MLLADSASTPLSKQPVCQENQFLAIYPRVVSGISVRIASTFGLTCAPLILTSPFVLRLLQQSPGKRGFTSLQEKGVMRSTSYKCFHDFFSHHEGLCATSCDLKLSIQREVRMTKFNGIRFCRCPLLRDTVSRCETPAAPQIPGMVSCFGLLMEVSLLKYVWMGIVSTWFLKKPKNTWGQREGRRKLVGVCTISAAYIVPVWPT